ncbi:MAG: NAD(+) synthase [Verrucomicrobia bacterium]|nr:NAD(+) synthase [Verrucomicrobiota bacterium]
MSFSKQSVNIDPAVETERIVSALRHNVRKVMRRGGAVLGISGGVDSSVVLALCVRAFGPERVVALMLPEKDSDPLSERLARELAAQFGVTPILEGITPVLEGFGCYPRRDEAIRRVFPEYDAAGGWKAKIVLPANLLDDDTLNVFSVTVVSPEGKESTKPLGTREFLQIVAASNFKQRTRMAMLYYHAELRNYAVIGTANKNEHDQGFFVKHGDAGVDLQAIVHLYKTQVYQLAEFLQVPAEIRQRPPTSDTYSAACTQEEFFFRLPFETMDLLWYAQEHQVPVAEVAQVMGLTEAQVQRAFADFTRKQRTTDYLRLPPLVVRAGEAGA